MKLTINAISANTGGAVTYLQNVLPELRRQLGDENSNPITVWRGLATTGSPHWASAITYYEHARANQSMWRRLWFDQVELPRKLADLGTDVLFSSANYGPLRCPCRQILLVRNPIYFDATFMSRMRSPRVKTLYLLHRALTLACMKVADVVLFPTQAMLDLVASHTKGAKNNWRVALYGTRHDLFYPTTPPRSLGTTIQLLHVSLYCDQKNLGTFLEALQMLEQQQPKRYHLRLTAGFSKKQNDWAASPFFPNFAKEKALYEQLHHQGIAEDTDWKLYGTLPELYRSADIFVFPSYTESFGHPLVEAMASGLPIVAADMPVNRELCGEAAIYFAPFDAADCARAIAQVAENEGLRAKMRDVALVRAQTFTWERHVASLVEAFLKDKKLN